MKQIGVAVRTYADEYDDALPWGSNESTAHPYLAYRCRHSGNDVDFQDTSVACICGTMGKPRPMRLACLYERKQIKDGRVFYCPAGSKDPGYRYDSYIQSEYGNEWGTPHQTYSLTKTSNDWIRTGYGYYPVDGFFDSFTIPPPELIRNQMNRDNNGLYAPKIDKIPTKFSKLSSFFPYLTDDIFKKTNLSHASRVDPVSKRVYNGGINALFKDGHVVFVKDKEVIIRGNRQTMFNNDIWNVYDPPSGSPLEETTTKAQYIFFNMYWMISK
jgi:hypothetical protein